MESFVIEYNRATHDRRVTQFASREAAVEYRIAREQLGSPEIEVAVLLSQSLAALRRTHSRYFVGDEIACA